jgi:hypothetical protein
MMNGEHRTAAACSTNSEEQLKVILAAVESENRWVKDFIDRLAGVIRDVKR